MKSIRYLFLGVVLLLLSFLFIYSWGGSSVVDVSIPNEQWTVDDITVQIDSDHEKEIVRLVSKSIQGKRLYLRFSAVSRGKCWVDVYFPNGEEYFQALYVHPGNIITRGSYFGECNGGYMIPIMICLFFLIVLAGLIPEYVRGTKENYYQYQNVKNLGLIIYITALLTMQIPLLMAYGGIQAAIILLMRSVEVISYVLLPFFFIVSILVTISNIVLMKKEGRSIYNMLGCFLGIAICAGILFPRILSELLQRSSVIDVHNEQGIYLYIEIFVENAISVIVFYLDCILAATIILAFRAAKNVPSFNQSYILILGCQIKPDGSVTNLLKGRADRAIEFAAMQKEKTGKPIVFVPSGGQGEDEVTSEAQAIKNYLLSQGIAEKDILVEDQSTDTKENFAFSMDKIEKAGGSREDAIAFSTTNYHVFRSGILASMQGIKAEGIGSKTKSYFWVNAFIREFIATLYTERKTHIRVILGLTLIVMVMAVILFANAVL